MGRLTSSLSVSRVSVLPVVEEDAMEGSHLVVHVFLKTVISNFQPMLSLTAALQDTC